MASTRTLIVGGTVLHGPALTGTFRKADVLIEHDTITAIGSRLPADDAEVIPADGAFVLPGFVDTHAHLWEATMRGLTSDWNLAEFFWGVRVNHTALHTPEDLYAGVYAGALASLDSGTTTSLDHAHAILTPEHADAMLEGVGASGMRTVWAYGLTGAPTPDPAFASPEDRFRDLRRIRAAHTDGRLCLGVAVNDPLAVAWQVTEQEYALAKELDLLVTGHLNSVPTPQRVPEAVLLHRGGLLGPRQVYSHANTSSDEELGLLAVAGAAVSCTPESEAQMGMGFPVLGRARAASVTVGLGSDLQANNSPDAFTQMRLARHLDIAHTSRPILETAGLTGLGKVSVTTREALHLATMGGAEALGMADRIGSLEPGKAADLILLRNDSPRQRPIVDPFATVVEHSGVGDIDRVLIAGETVKANGRLVGGTGERAVRLVEAAWERLSDRMAEHGGPSPAMPDGVLEAAAASMAPNLPEWFSA
ncbi:amidohydrolase family protein [Streptomyces xiamenensis]